MAPHGVGLIGWVSHPGLSGGDVLQGSGRTLARTRVRLADLQDTVVQTHYLRVPQPLCPFRYSCNFREGGQILILLQRHIISIRNTSGTK